LYVDGGNKRAHRADAVFAKKSPQKTNRRVHLFTLAFIPTKAAYTKGARSLRAVHFSFGFWQFLFAD